MVKHLVFWKLKESAHGNSKAENANKIKEMLENLSGQIEGLIQIEVGIDFLGNGNFDLALYSVVKDRATLDYYQNHPLHQATLPFIRGAVEDRKAVDYEI